MTCTHMKKALVDSEETRKMTNFLVWELDQSLKWTWDHF